MHSERIREPRVRLIHRLIPKTCASHAALIFGLLLLCLVSYVCDGIAADFTGQVVDVIDGDTIRVLYEKKTEAMRLDGVDCPEQNRLLGRRAKAFTSSEAMGKEVTVKVTRQDQSGRRFVEITLPDGRNLNRELLRAGWCSEPLARK